MNIEGLEIFARLSLLRFSARVSASFPVSFRFGIDAPSARIAAMLALKLGSSRLLICSEFKLRVIENASIRFRSEPAAALNLL